MKVTGLRNGYGRYCGCFVLLSLGLTISSQAHGLPEVKCLALLPDGKSLVGGSFTSFEGQPFKGLVRVNSDGSVDDTFQVDLRGVSDLLPATVRAMAVQCDGKLVIAGDFEKVNGEARPGIARIEPDGTLDKDFAASLIYIPSRPVSCIAVQEDGKILVGGNGVARLNTDGTVDRTFRVTGAYGGVVSAILVQADRAIVVGGDFIRLGNVMRSKLGRLHPDGTFDDDFTPACDGRVYSLAFQGDGKILVGGLINSLAGGGARGLGRLNPDGTLDAGFQTSVFGGIVSSLAIQADGRIIVGGNFSSWTPPLNNVARLNANGTLDATFVALPFSNVAAAAIRGNGTVVLAGDMTMSDGKSHPFVQSMRPPDAIQELFYDGSAIMWLHGGNSPEMTRVIYEASTNDEWVRVGDAQRISGGWQLEGVSLSPGQSFRARACTSGSSSQWVTEGQVVIPGPVIVKPPTGSTNFTDTVASFKVLVASAVPCAYQWTLNGIHLANATNGSLTIPNVRMADAGAYSVVVSSMYGDVTSPAAMLNVVRRPEFLVGERPWGIFTGRMGFYLAGSPGQKAIIESSTDLKQWSPIGTNVLTSQGIRFTDFRPATVPSRFYRLRAAP